eukprot:m.180278 g.180278  ORF g.180278 m.180278 type:complete len:1544 (-) comp15495_c0_seq6:2437-7068(-)
MSGLGDLMRASQSGDWRMVALVICERRADINARDGSGYSALHYACSAGRRSVAQMLVDNGADVNSLNSLKGQTPLHCACNGAHIDLVKLILSQPEVIISINAGTRTDGITPLHYVAASDHSDAAAIADLLIQHGALANTQDTAGNTPLYYCCRRGTDANLAKVLIRGGADCTTISSQMITPIHLAAIKGNAEIINLLVRAGADPNGLSTKETLPPLHLAVQRHHKDAAMALLECGAHVNLPSTTERRPIHFAAFRKDPDIVQLLVDYSANIDALDQTKHTALAYAAFKGCIDTTTLLLALGADPNTRTKEEKWTPLHGAAREGHSVTVAVLSSHAATDIDARDAELRTPLHWAVFSENVPSVMMLLEHGANALYEDKAGRTPQFIAQVKGLHEISSVLLQHIGVSLTPQKIKQAKYDDLASYWITRSASLFCMGCMKQFSMTVRRHACKLCRRVFCSRCSSQRLPSEHRLSRARVCQNCFKKECSALLTSAVGKNKAPVVDQTPRPGREDYLKRELQKLEQFMVEQAEDNNQGYNVEYRMLEAVGRRHSKKASSASSNLPKNRYPDIKAYDHSRVKLSSRLNKGHSDYINANYVFPPWAPKGPAGFIAAQGPLPDTSLTFWQMAWEQNAHIIVMVTSLVEGNRQKCAQYWPGEQNISEVYGDFEVMLVEEENLKFYIHRVFSLRLATSNTSTREIHQYAFCKWPDHGVPRSTQQLIKFHAAVSEKRREVGGIVIVHCSAGVGRTGTFIALDWLIDVIRKGSTPINIMALLRAMRECRNYMVQSIEQFIFVHKLCVSVLKQDLGLPVSRPSSRQSSQKRKGATSGQRKGTQPKNSSSSSQNTLAEVQSVSASVSSSGQAGSGSMRRFELQYIGSQQVHAEVGESVVLQAIHEVNQRRAVARRIVLQIAARGIEIIEAGQDSGAVFNWKNVTYYHADVLFSKPSFGIIIRDASRNSNRGCVCHCFEAPSSETMDDLANFVAETHMYLFRNYPNSIDAKCRDELELKAAVALSRNESAGRNSEINPDEDLMLALTLSKSLAEHFPPKQHAAPDVPDRAVSAVWEAAATTIENKIQVEPSNPFFEDVSDSKKTWNPFLDQDKPESVSADQPFDDPEATNVDPAALQQGWNPFLEGAVETNEPQDYDLNLISDEPLCAEEDDDVNDIIDELQGQDLDLSPTEVNGMENSNTFDEYTTNEGSDLNVQEDLRGPPEQSQVLAADAESQNYEENNENNTDMGSNVAIDNDAVEVVSDTQNSSVTGRRALINKPGSALHGEQGIILYGPLPVDFKAGSWYGLELDNPKGKNDGEVNGKRYFACKPHHGIFAKEQHVQLSNDSDESEKEFCDNAEEHLESSQQLSNATETPFQSEGNKIEQDVAPTDTNLIEQGESEQPDDSDGLTISGQHATENTSIGQEVAPLPIEKQDDIKMETVSQHSETISNDVHSQSNVNDHQPKPVDSGVIEPVRANSAAKAWFEAATTTLTNGKELNIERADYIVSPPASEPRTRTPSPHPSLDDDAESSTLALINKYREEVGLPPVTSLDDDIN